MIFLMDLCKKKSLSNKQSKANMARRQPKSRYWCFTVANPDGLIDADAAEGLVYLVYQQEVSHETLLSHFQGYCEWANEITRSTVQRRLDIDGAHCEIRKGTQEQAIAYCTKEDTRVDGPWTFGTPMAGRGRRLDLEDLRLAIRSGSSDLEVADAHFSSFIRYNRGIKEYKRLVQPVRAWKTEVIVCYGKPGTGKSKWVQQQAPNAYWKPRSQWWCGYEGQSDVVMDDYYGWLPFDTLLRVLDEYPLLVETKGAQAQFMAKRIFITSNKLPDEWYHPDPRYNFDALYRRIDRFRLFLAIGVEAEEWPIKSAEVYQEVTQRLMPAAIDVFELGLFADPDPVDLAAGGDGGNTGTPSPDDRIITTTVVASEDESEDSSATEDWRPTDQQLDDMVPINRTYESDDGGY